MSLNSVRVNGKKMNKRIEELSVQAEKYADDNFRGEPTWSEAYESKFAELIVRECADLIDTLNEAYEAPSTGGKFIKEHFGVKE